MNGEKMFDADGQQLFDFMERYPRLTSCDLCGRKFLQERKVVGTRGEHYCCEDHRRLGELPL